LNTATFDDDTVWTARNDYAYDTRLLFKRRITTSYIAFTNLRSYIDINYSGFRKIIKKYDKVTFSELKDKYLHNVVETSTPFSQEHKTKLDDGVTRLVELYARCVTQNDRTAAQHQLRFHQRENIAWERDTVWRQMIGQERRGEGSRMDLGGATLVKDPEKPLVNIPTPVGRFKITSKLIWGTVASVAFVVLLNMNIFQAEEAKNCLAILVFCTILWASEVSWIQAVLSSCRLYLHFRLYLFLLRPSLCLCFSSHCVSSGMKKTLYDCQHQMRQSLCDPLLLMFLLLATHDPLSSDMSFLSCLTQPLCFS